MIALLKQPTLHSQALRDSARDETCTVQYGDHCNHDPQTTVLAHLPDDSGTGKMGGKSDDWNAVYACSGCHSWIDNHKDKGPLRDWYLHRAHKRTLKRMVSKGLIIVKGAKW